MDESQKPPEPQLQPLPQPQPSVPLLTLEEVKAIKGRPPRAVASQVKAVTTAKNLRVTTHNKQEVIKERDKLDAFIESYLETGNATESAMRVFSCPSRSAASALGSYYLNKARDLGRIMLENNNLHAQELIRKAGKRMDDPKSPDFVALFDRLMKLGGYADFLVKQNINKNTINVVTEQKDLFDEYVEGEFVEDAEEEEE